MTLENKQISLYEGGAGFKYEDVKDTVNKFENYLNNLQSKFTGEKCFDVFELFEDINKKYREMFGDFEE